MKQRFLGLVVTSLISLALSPATEGAVAVSSQPDNGTPTSGSLHAKIVLTPTPAAPVDSSAVAELDGRYGPGAGLSTLLVTAQRLTPGPYSIGAVRKSDGSTVFLGWIAVGFPGLGPEQRAGESTHERSSAHQTVVIATQTLAELPPYLDPRDIAWIVIADVGGNALLVGDVAGTLKN